MSQSVCVFTSPNVYFYILYEIFIFFIVDIQKNINHASFSSYNETGIGIKLLYYKKTSLSREHQTNTSYKTPSDYRIYWSKAIHMESTPYTVKYSQIVVWLIIDIFLTVVNFNIFIKREAFNSKHCRRLFTIQIR